LGTPQLKARGYRHRPVSLFYLDRDAGERIHNRNNPIDYRLQLLINWCTCFALEAISKIGFWFKIPSSLREKRGFAETGATGPSLKPQATCWLSRI